MLLQMALLLPPGILSSLTEFALTQDGVGLHRGGVGLADMASVLGSTWATLETGFAIFFEKRSAAQFRLGEHSWDRGYSSSIEVRPGYLGPRKAGFMD